MAKEILQGTWDALPKQPADHTVPWWTNVFERESDRIDLCLPAPREVLWDLVKPITTKEVRHCLKGVTGSPGPDGLSWYQIKQYLHPASIAPYFNNWLAAGRLPTQVKIGYTNLIPKEVGATEPEKMRPITVTSTLVRLFHRILARRFERILPSSQLQRGFKAGDGCGSNKRLLEAVIHE